MFSPPTPHEHEIAFRDGALEFCVSVSDDGLARLVRLFAPASDDTWSDPPISGRHYLPGLPLVDVITSGSGRAWSGGRYIESVTGGRLRLAASEQHTSGRWEVLTFRLEDPDSSLRSEVAYRVLRGGGVLRRERPAGERGFDAARDRVCHFVRHFWTCRSWRRSR